MGAQDSVSRARDKLTRNSWGIISRQSLWAVAGALCRGQRIVVMLKTTARFLYFCLGARETGLAMIVGGLALRCPAQGERRLTLARGIQRGLNSKFWA